MGSEVNFDDQALLRYSRQIMLPEVDIEGQEKLAHARVLLIGLGGLGSPVALYLAAAGVGHLILVDYDKVELTNLQRQIAHSMKDLDRLKVDSVRDSIRELNPLVEVTVVPRALQDNELLAQVQAADVVIDASDNITTRMAINRACIEATTALVSGAAIRFEGQVMVVRPDQPQSPCYRCLYRSEEELAETCAQSGVIAPLLGIIGSVQAIEAMKLIMGIGTTLSGRLLLLDALHMEWHSVQIRKNPDCPVCSDRQAAAVAPGL